MTKLELTNLRKEYTGLVAVESLDLAIDEGETVALLGPSGCGKSTTLNMIVGLERPTAGDIRIDGKSVVDLPPGKRNIGLVFQDYAIFTNMTVEQNLSFGLRIAGIARETIRRKVAKVAELLHLSADLGRPVTQLGASQIQRVAIGRTLVTNPSILLLDEPLSNLEVSLRNQMRRELRRIQNETRQTIIYVTHDQIEALSLAHRIAVMDQGRLQQYGTAYNVYHFPANKFVGSFLGTPPMNFLSGTLANRQGGWVLAEGGAGEIPIPVNGGAASWLQEGRRILVGMRPETIKMVPDDAPRAFSARTLAVEPQGPETIVLADVAGQQIKLAVPADRGLAVGDVVHLLPKPELLAFFDADSGVRLDARGGRHG
jgi:multiple sugar transport system ATP-binding protein